MDLWIRTQSHENTVKIINGYGLKYNDKKIIIANYQPDFTDKYDGYYEVLGTYKTKKRALEVLDDMDDHIGFLNVEMCAGRFGELDFQTDIIFQMPKE